MNNNRHNYVLKLKTRFFFQTLQFRGMQVTALAF